MGLTAFNTKAHIARAALEAAAFQTKDVIDAMHADCGIQIERLKIDGGMTNNALVMQFQADLLNIPLHRPETAETTSLGSAFAAGLAVGFWSSVEDLKKIWKLKTCYTPQITESRRKYLVIFFMFLHHTLSFSFSFKTFYRCASGTRRLQGACT